MLLHRDPADDHPEQPARIEGILRRFANAGLLSRCVHVPAGELSVEALRATHTAGHLEFMDSIPSRDEEELVALSHQMDSIYLCRESEVGAKAAVASTCKIATDIALGRLRNGFALVRPPGHHAESGHAQGFCLFNNVAVAIKELQRLGLARRIMVLDWDVHHGNGTQRIFANDAEVLFISLHRHDNGTFYPAGVEGAARFVGGEAAPGFSVNVAWSSAGATNADYMAAFRHVVLPIAAEFGPDFVFVSAGFDAAEGDPIGGCRVTPYGYAQMTHQLMGLAGGRILLVLEGGYNVPVIADCAEACLNILVGEPIPYEQDQALALPSPAAMQAISATIRAQSPYWKSLYPRHFSKLEGATPADFSLQDLHDICWSQICQKQFKMIPLPIAEESLSGPYGNRVHISDNLLDSPLNIVVFAHESGTVYSGNGDSNIVDLGKGAVHMPFARYLEEAIGEGWATVDFCIPTHRWRLKQNQTGAADELLTLNEMLIYLWDGFLALSGATNIFFVTSGLPSYAVCNLMEKRLITHMTRGVVAVSPTLFLPVAAPERASWYAQHSLIVVPTRRPEGSAIATNPSFGNCISSGGDEPLGTNVTIERFRSQIFTFLHDCLGDGDGERRASLQN